MQNNWTIYSRVLWSIITACYSPLSWRHSHACVSRIICCQSCFRILLVTMYSTVRSVDCLLQYLASRSVAFANTHTRIHKTYTSVHSGKTTEEFNSFRSCHAEDIFYAWRCTGLKSHSSCTQVCRVQLTGRQSRRRLHTHWSQLFRLKAHTNTQNYHNTCVQK